MSRLSLLASASHLAARHCAKAILLVVVVLLVQPIELYAQQPIVKINRTVTLDEIGDARIKLEIKAPTNQYTAFKANTPNMAVLLRRLGAGATWSELDSIEGRFDDNTSTIVIDYTERGLARTSAEDVWFVAFPGGEQMDHISTHATEAIFTQSANTDLGLTTIVLKIIAPQGSRDLRVERGPERFVFELDPSSNTLGDDTELAFECDVKPYIMAALAKSYGNAGFANLWTARSVLKNTGTASVNDFRVRFRVADHSSWSSWKRSQTVLPGQTVVDPFFPVLDVEKLAKMTGSRPATLEVEYEYKTASGETVRESDSQSIQLLSRNQVVFSSLPSEEIMGFHDAFDYGPALLASMVTSEDPVMQQFAGAVSGLAGGVAASANDEDALKYIEAVYNFMADNNVAYQTPPGLLVSGSNGQHIKYGRDVLRNRAGTCVDLAVLYASAYEAVGLRPVLVLIPGHCFPACYLPSGQLVAVESTAAGKYSFQDALTYGMKELEEARQNVAYFIDIADSRAMGLHSIDLPEVPVNFLGELGYQTNAADTNNRNVEQVNYEQNDRPVPSNGNLPASFVGKWVFDGNVEGVRLTAIAVFAENGSYAGYIRTVQPNGYTEENNSQGGWGVEGNKVVVRSEQGTFTRPFKFENGTLWVYFAEIDYTLGFTRAN